MEKNFKKGEIVWAKMRGFPWWPGRIKSISHKHNHNTKEDEESLSDYFYTIDFFGDNSHVELPGDKVDKFKDNYSEYSNTKQKKLLKAIEMAKKMLNIQQSNNQSGMTTEKNTNENFLGRKTMIKGNNAKDSITNSAVGASAKNIKINININVTNNNHNTINISSFSDLQKTNLIANAIQGQQQIPVDSVTKEHEGKTNEKDKNDDKGNDTKENDDGEDEDEEEKEEEENPEEKLKKTVNEFLRSRIDIPSSNTTKYIIKSIEEIENQLKDIAPSSVCSIYELTKDIISILMSLTSNDNQDIFIKSSQLLTLIREKTFKELFDLSNEELQNYPNIDQSSLITKDTIDGEIYQANLKGNQWARRRQKNKDRTMSSASHKTSIEVNEVLKDNDPNDKDIEDFLHILHAENYRNGKEIFSNLSDDYFKNAYAKRHEDMAVKNALLRKYVCIKILKILKKIVPLWNEDDLRRMVIYFEHKEHLKDTSFGRSYLQYIDGLYNALRSFHQNQTKNKHSKINE